MKFLRLFAIAIIFAVLLTGETEARRKVLKGRKTVTRKYVSEPAIPAWAICLLVGLGELLVGGIVFFIMKKCILDGSVSGGYAVVNNFEK